MFDRIVTGNLERAQQPARFGPGCIHVTRKPIRCPPEKSFKASADFEGSIEEARTAIAMDPDLGLAYVNMAYSYFALGRASEAEKIIRRASERGFNPPEMLFLRYSIAFSRNNSDDMNRVVALAQGKPWAEDWITQAQALTAAAPDNCNSLGSFRREPSTLRFEPNSLIGLRDTKLVRCISGSYRLPTGSDRRRIRRTQVLER